MALGNGAGLVTGFGAGLGGVGLGLGGSGTGGAGGCGTASGAGGAINCAMTSAAITWGSGGLSMLRCRAQMPATCSANTAPVMTPLWPQVLAGANRSEEDIKRSYSQRMRWPNQGKNVHRCRRVLHDLRGARLRRFMGERSTKHSPKPKLNCLQRLRRMPCFALQNRIGELNCVRRDVVVNGGAATLDAAFRHHIAGTAFTLPALGGNAKFKLNLVKTHTGMRMACNFAVRHPMAYTNDHDFKQC